MGMVKSVLCQEFMFMDSQKPKIPNLTFTRYSDSYATTLGRVNLIRLITHRLRFFILLSLFLSIQ